MCAGAHGNTGPVDHHGHIVGMDAFELEGDDRALALGIAKNAQRIDLTQPFMRVIAQIFLMRENGGAADLLDIFYGSAKTDGLGDRRRARLETVRRNGRMASSFSLRP